MTRGFDLVNRFGPEIEYDFHSLLSGLDLTDWFTGRDAPSWGKLLRLAWQLPMHGRFKAALLDDDDYAASVGLADDSEDKDHTFGLVDYNPTVEKLTDIGDVLIAIRSTLIAANSEKGKAPKDTKFMRRPETAFDRLRRSKSRDKRDYLMGVLVPGE